MILCSDGGMSASGDDLLVLGFGGIVEEGLTIGCCLLAALLATRRSVLAMIGALSSIPNLAMGPTNVIPLVPCFVLKSFVHLG